MIFTGKKVLVFGTGKSGIAAEELLHKKGASVVLYDGNDKLEKEEILKKLDLVCQGRFVYGLRRGRRRAR